jgi:hypothetical protein
MNSPIPQDLKTEIDNALADMIAEKYPALVKALDVVIETGGTREGVRVVIKNALKKIGVPSEDHLITCEAIMQLAERKFKEREAKDGNS